jgi:hypothetical protein
VWGLLSFGGEELNHRLHSLHRFEKQTGNVSGVDF